jgi:signal transduction histidine kinase
VHEQSKIEAGKVVLEPTAFSIRQCVESAVDVIANKAHSKGLEIISTTQPDVPHMIVQDYNRLTQILFNLLSNAVKFSQEGDLLLTVEVLRSASTTLHECPSTDSAAACPPASPPSRFVQFSVQDSGIGPDQQHQPLPNHGVRFTALNRLCSSRSCVMSCCDTGMLPSALPRLFLPFSQVHAATEVMD